MSLFAKLTCISRQAQLQAVSIRIQTMSSTAAMADAMKGAARAMYAMNRQVNLPAMQRVMMQFEKEGDMMEMKQELMDDTIDDVMGQVAAILLLSPVFSQPVLLLRRETRSRRTSWSTRCWTRLASTWPPTSPTPPLPPLCRPSPSTSLLLLRQLPGLQEEEEE